MNMRRPEMRELEDGRMAMMCPFCGHEVIGDLSSGEALYKSLQKEFRDDLSIKEFFQSNLCQKCQDDFFDEVD